MIQCFMLEPSNTVRRWLRRYVHLTGGSGEWSCAGGWHEAMVHFNDAPAVWEERADPASWKHTVVLHAEEDKPPDDDPRWPTKCDKCEYHFAPDDVHQFFYDLIYIRVDTGQAMSLRDAPAGAMWDAWWLHGLWGGALAGPTADGLNLFVRLPNGRDWHIDGRASNCTLPKDNEHHCWCRHGTPPVLVVDKNGVTCQAGAGSIQAGTYHGFLGIGGAPPGYLTE